MSKQSQRLRQFIPLYAAQRYSKSTILKIGKTDTSQNPDSRVGLDIGYFRINNFLYFLQCLRVRSTPRSMFRFHPSTISSPESKLRVNGIKLKNKILYLFMHFIKFWKRNSTILLLLHLGCRIKNEYAQIEALATRLLFINQYSNLEYPTINKHLY